MKKEVWVTLVVLTFGSRMALALPYADQVAVEAVNNYGGSGDLTNCIPMVDQFRDKVTALIPIGTNTHSQFFFNGLRACPAAKCGIQAASAVTFDTALRI